MVERTDKPDGGASVDDPRLVKDVATGDSSREDARSDEGEKTDGERADTEIAAGDLADDLADFA